MSGIITKEQRLNRFLHPLEFRLYKKVWKALISGNYNHVNLSLPYFIEKFGAI